MRSIHGIVFRNIIDEEMVWGIRVNLLKLLNPTIIILSSSFS